MARCLKTKPTVLEDRNMNAVIRVCQPTDQQISNLEHCGGVGRAEEGMENKEIIFLQQNKRAGKVHTMVIKPSS